MSEGEMALCRVEFHNSLNFKALPNIFHFSEYLNWNHSEFSSAAENPPFTHGSIFCFTSAERHVGLA